MQGKTFLSLVLVVLGAVVFYVGVTGRTKTFLGSLK